MSGTVRLAIMAVALVAALVATALVTRHVVWGGEPTAEGSLSHVRPGQDDAGATTAYHYRLTSRLGYYVKIHATDSAVSVSGPRVSPGLYAFFIGGQVLLMLLVYVALLAAVMNWEWRYLPVALGLFVGNFVFTLACAGGLWALPDVMAIATPGTLDNCVFAHCSAEPGHAALLRHLHVKPLLELEMRLGEGTGAALAVPIIRAAELMLREMADLPGEHPA